jgi:hypothetical protein
MKLAAFETVAKALDAAQVRYLVAGGLAVNAHGYVRFTADIDMVVALDADNIARAFKALSEIGYSPSIPITAEMFAKPEQRRQWMEEKGMQVLNFHSNTHPETSVDVFVHEPFDFAQEYAAAMKGELLPNVTVRFVSIPTLIRMKQVTGRARDIDDIEHLRWLQKDNEHD